MFYVLGIILSKCLLFSLIFLSLPFPLQVSLCTLKVGNVAQAVLELRFFLPWSGCCTTLAVGSESLLPDRTRGNGLLKLSPSGPPACSFPHSPLPLLGAPPSSPWWSCLGYRDRYRVCSCSLAGSLTPGSSVGSLCGETRTQSLTEAV